MNLRVLRYFLTVAKEQSFTKAAEQLNLTQPTLSRQLAALEEELGAKLFDRGGRSITLTGEGVLLKRQALEIVEMEDKILSEFKGSQEFMEGTITIGCGDTCGNLPQLSGKVSESADRIAYRDCRCSVRIDGKRDY